MFVPLGKPRGTLGLKYYDGGGGGEDHVGPWVRPQPTNTVLRARGTLFRPKVARELMKFNETRTIRSEIERGKYCYRSEGPEMDKMIVFDTPTCLEMALQVPRLGSAFLLHFHGFGCRFHILTTF